MGKQLLSRSNLIFLERFLLSFFTFLIAGGMVGALLAIGIHNMIWGNVLINTSLSGIALFIGGATGAIIGWILGAISNAIHNAFSNKKKAITISGIIGAIIGGFIGCIPVAFFSRVVFGF